MSTKFLENWKPDWRVDSWNIPSESPARRQTICGKSADTSKKELLAPQAAQSTIAAIKAEILSLRGMPSRIHLTPEEPWHSFGVRRARANNFYIYFWIDEENRKVQIIGVIYIRRDQAKQLTQMDMQ